MKLSIVIPTITPKLAERCIDSIIKFTNLNDIEIIVVYQGKEKWDIEKKHECIKLLKFDEPLGPVIAFNKGIEKTSGLYIMILNDDCAVLDSKKDYWINELLKPFENPKVAVTGPFKMPPVLGANGLNFTEDKIKYGFILFFCAVIPRRIFDEIGILDDTLLCGVDVDFCMRVKEKGYEIKQVPEADLNLGVPGKLAIGTFPFYHEGEGTVHDFYGEQWQKMLKTDVKVLNERYGKSEKKVSIVIPTMTRELVLRCIGSIISYTDLTNIEIIVVANGADNELKNDIKYLQDNKIPIKLLWYDEALGPIKPYNIGIKEANAEYILLLNDDCEIIESKKHTWIDALIAPFFEISNMGCVGSEIYICHYDRKPMNIDYSLIYFYCAMIPKRIFNEIGLLDENLKCSVDLDFCLRLQQNGYTITKANFPDGFPLKHEGRVSVYKNHTPEEWFKIIQKDNLIIGKRYSRISIIITVYGDRLDEVNRCLESVYKYTDLSNTEIVVIANAVSKRVDDYLKSLDYIRYYFYEEALGAVGAINKGLEKAVGLIKVMLNQDVVILNGDWLSMLVEPFKDKDVGATGPLMRPIENLEYNCLHGFCFALRNKVYKEIGPYDINFNPGCFEDVDYSVRIQKAGYKLVQVPERMVNEKQSKYGFEGAFPIFHKENHQNWMESEAFIKNKKYFYNKHKEYKFMEREIVMPWWPVVQKKYELIMIQEFLKNYKIENVLEIGTFRGGTAMLWAHMVAPLNGHVYCADMRFNWSTHPHEHSNPLEIQFPGQVYNNSEYEKYITEIQGDTHDKDFVKKVENIAGEVDLIFIDGDHSYDGVKQDFENYMHLVKSGGYIMFHDITESDYHNKSDCRVHILWNQIKDLYESWEFFDNNEYPGCPARSMGIGIIQVPQKGNIPEKYYNTLDEAKVLTKSNYAKVTAYISTKDRYFTTLPMAIASIATQTVKPNEFILIDDGEQKDLRNDGVYSCLFKMLDESGIKWKVLFGKRTGQVANHQMMLTEAKNDIIWRCFKGFEKVETTTGMKKIKDINVGDMVKTHMGRYMPVIKTYKHEYKGELIEVSTANSKIKCTTEHPFLVNLNGDVKWCNANKLNSNMMLLYPDDDHVDTIDFNCNSRGSKSKVVHENTNLGNKWINEYFGTLQVDKDLARFFGLYLAEGCGGHDSIRFTFNNNEKDYIDFVVNICKSKFKRMPTIHTRWATTVKLNIKSFSTKFIEWFGHEATIKRVPEFVFSWNLQNKLEFLKGYLDGDGWICGNKIGSKRARFGTSSIELFLGIKRLLNDCGIESSELYTIPTKIGRISGRVVKSGEHYSGTLKTRGYSKFLDLLTGEHVNGYINIPIKNVNTIKESNMSDKNVYNLEVLGDNTYIVGPCIVHNCDDDNYMESDVLDKLLSKLLSDDKIGAVAGRSIIPDGTLPRSQTSGMIDDLYTKPHIQWSKFSGSEEVDHLHNTFLFRKAAAKHGYHMGLSPVGHREETMFSYGMKLAGWKVVVMGDVNTWHLRQPQGGIRSFNDGSMWAHDEDVFKKWMADKSERRLDNSFIAVLDSGLGDHFDFLSILPEIKAKHKNIILATCYPDVFKDEGVTQISIAEAAARLGNIENHNVYKFMAERNWKSSIKDAYRKLYGII